MSASDTGKICTLPTAKRKEAAEIKYAAAVRLYGSSALSLREVAEQSGVSAFGLSAHIGKYHRNLLYARYGLDAENETSRMIKVKSPKGQSGATVEKYKEAIDACGDMAYLEFNISQIARMFGLDGSALAAQLRVHHEGVIEKRESLRRSLGLADNIRRGARRCSEETYSEALLLYRDTEMTMREVAERCRVSKSGFCQFMRFYHKDIIDHKASRRRASANESGNKKNGRMSGNGQPYGPKPETVLQYAPALKLYLSSSLPVKEIAAKTGVPVAGLHSYLRQWCPGEILRRRGFEWDGKSEVDLQASPHCLKSTAEKYAGAIASLKSDPRPVAAVAREFGHNPEVFRQYLKKHKPGLVGGRRKKNLNLEQGSTVTSQKT